MKPLFKALFTGDRNWDDPAPVERKIKKLKEEAHERDSELLIIHGGARGLDQMADHLAKNLNVHTARVDALWDTRHRPAGMQRNLAMLGLEPHIVVAFHERFKQSKGTKGCVRAAEKIGIKVDLENVSS